jgi:iron complex outermembrane receptor protein
MKNILSISIASVIVHSIAFAENPADPAPMTLDETIVTAPLARTLFEQAQPVSILKGDRLLLTLQPTLGETLSRTPGVRSTYYGPAASRPIIRGQDGDRIRILQNGSNTIDASATSVDHAVSFDPVSVESIEVVRGPATLLYGPNAIGGVVNAIDGRIPDQRIPVPVRGSLEAHYGSANTERAGSFTLEGGLGGFAWHIEGYKRETLNLHIPGYARSEQRRLSQPLDNGETEAYGVLRNSDMSTEGLSGGASYIWNSGFFGLAYSGFNTDYGSVAEPNVRIGMNQRRWDFRGGFTEPFAHIKAIKYSLSVSDYQHTEFEDGAPGTTFKNRGYDGRIEFTHEKVGPFEGAFGFQTERSDFSALGEEAFVPRTLTLTNSLFLFEEIARDPVRFQFGLRYDHITADAEAGDNFGPARDRTFDNLSASVGVIYTPVEGYAIALNGAFSQRAPTYQELFANGPHVATGAFEIGDDRLKQEKALSLDLSFRKKTGRVTGALSFFYNHYTDYIGQFANGETRDLDGEALPVYAYRPTDAEFYGGELEVTFHLLDPAVEPVPAGKDGRTAAPPPKPQHKLDLELKADYVRATDLNTGRPLPRISPIHASAALNYSYDRFTAGIEGQFSGRQNRTADFETATDSYMLLNANLSYKLPLGRTETTLYIKGVNLTNEEAREHTSFLKDIAPLSGRGVVCGMKLTF